MGRRWRAARECFRRRLHWLRGDDRSRVLDRFLNRVPLSLQTLLFFSRFALSTRVVRLRGNRNDIITPRIGSTDLRLSDLYGSGIYFGQMSLLPYRIGDILRRVRGNRNIYLNDRNNDFLLEHVRTWV